MAKIEFTAGEITKHACEAGKSQSFIWDSAAPGLGLRATPNGRKCYVFQSKLSGKTIRINIGSPPVWGIKQAQIEARRLQTVIDRGEDPRQLNADELAAKQAERDTLEAAKLAQQATEDAQRAQDAIERARKEMIARIAWDAYLAHPRPPTGKKSWGSQHRADHDIAANPGGDACKIGDKMAKPAPLASLLAMPLHSITAAVVQEWLTLECKTRPTFAHNCLRKFKAFIRWCSTHTEYKDVVHADCCLADVVKDITPVNKTKEGDCLQREQLAAWFDAVHNIGNPVISAYLQALLITGARRGELEILRWEDVEFNPKWASMTIRDKVEGLRTIPLTPYLAQLIGALPRREGGWVFSSPSAESGHITEPRIAHTKALQVAGLPHVSLHGLRRSFGTLSEWVEVPIGIVAQIQGHSASALAEKHYRRRPLDLLRMWHVKIESWILEQAGIEFVPVLTGLRVVTAA